MRTLLARMKAIREPRVRVAAAAEFLSTSEPADAIEAMLELIARAQRTGAADAVTALDALAAALTMPGRVSYATTSTLYRAARRAGNLSIARLLFGVFPAQPDRSDEDPERAVHPHGRSLTLGERKALARGCRRDVVRQLVREPHPDVIATLLTNPRTTETDVLAIASRRPTQPACQVAVFLSERWRPRYPVKRALALNPHTPVPLAARIMTTLRPRDVRRVAIAPGASPTLAAHAADLDALARSPSPR